MPSEDQVMATGNKHKKMVKFGCMVSEICEQANRQTGIQTSKQHTVRLRPDRPWPTHSVDWPSHWKLRCILLPTS